MAEKDIIQNMISRLGQSQDERLAPELDKDFFAVDDRSPTTLLRQAKKLAAKLNLYQHDPKIVSSNWSGLFPSAGEAELIKSTQGEVPPHLGLFATALELYQQPQDELNAFTARHAAFQYERVLGFKPQPARPDHAHLTFELKKGAPSTLISTSQQFSAGKGKDGVELLYRPVRDVVVGQAKVAALHSVYRNNNGVFFAPVANSADGLGAALPPEQPQWKPFGNESLPPARIGFAFASPLLSMQEGTRTVRLTLTLAQLDAAIHTATALASSLEAYVTGPKGWLGPYPISCSLTGNQLTVTLNILPTEPALTDYSAELHGLAFAARDPIIQLQLKPNATLRYHHLEKLTVSKAQVGVSVAGLKTLDLENDSGKLDPKKAFLPFGPLPVSGGRFMIGSKEALSKRLTALSVQLRWQGLPSNLGTHYSGYPSVNMISNGANARITYEDRSGQTTTSVPINILARDSAGLTTLSAQTTTPSPLSAYSLLDRNLFYLLFSGSAIARLLGWQRMLERPQIQRETVPPPTVRSGFITLTLEENFLHAEYRKETIRRATNKLDPINEPYTPTAQDISLSYTAESEQVDLNANQEGAFAHADVQFFHSGCFGQMREHAFLRNQLDFVSEKQVRLLPNYPDEGELLIGLSGIGAGENVDILFQVAEGSADPELNAADLQWSVLCDNYWRSFTQQEFTQDTSNDLRASGIVTLTLPRETDTEHTWMPTGLVWIKAAIKTGSAAACQLIDVAPNAVEVIYVQNNETTDSSHLSASLPAGSIAKALMPNGDVKKLLQPYASFGGKLTESADMLTRRAAERLRHRQRCITPWDYERMLLEEFPQVHKVKCIPHASDTSWLAPGHVMIVVIPDLRNQNAIDPLRPRVDLDTLTRMKEFAAAHCGPQVSLRVKNPNYQQVRLSFKVRFRPGFAFKFYRNELEQALIRTLTPWAYDATRVIDFGGRIYRSVILDFVEELPYVDFVSDFRLGIDDGVNSTLQDVSEVMATAPDIILVSDDSHDITELLDP